MKPTPMTAFRTITTARVMPPQAPAKPPAYATRFAQHIAMGKTPAQAMQAIERADGHSARLPIKLEASMCGGRGKARTKHAKPLTHRVMEALTAEWVFIDDAMTASIGSSRENIYAALRDLRDQGRVDQRKAKGHSRMYWRLKP